MTGDLLSFDQLPANFITSVRDRSRADADRDAWHRARLGKITGSRFGVVKKTRGGVWGETAESYLYELVGEWLTGQPSEAFTGNRFTEWGIENEPEALRLYAEARGVELLPGKFHRAGNLRLVGSTPDGMAGTDGVVEAKCPFMPKNHLRTVLTKQVPAEYQDQVDGHLLVTGRQWCDFISYDPRMPQEALRLAVVRVERNEARIQDLFHRLAEFEALLIERLIELNVPVDSIFKIETNGTIRTPMQGAPGAAQE